MRVALIHDWLLDLGGAERTLKVLHEMFPTAPIYTLFYNKKFTDNFLPQTEIRPSFLQRFYRLFKNHKLFLPFLPIAAESFDLSAFDLVISSSIAFSKGLILKPKTQHICYCYSPARFLWDWHSEYLKGRKSYGTKIAQHLLRLWDRNSADRVDQFVAISKNIQQRIKKYYGRDSIVIYPPVDINYKENRPEAKGNTFVSRRRFRNDGHNGFGGPLRNRCSAVETKSMFTGAYRESNQKKYKDYFLIVSRLFRHKNIDIAIQAFNKLELPLIIIGNGPEYGRLKSLIENRSLIKLLGYVPDTELPRYYSEAKAFVMPQEEDFGLAPIEAMNFGKPVLALKRGGALEYVLEGINGEFFDDPHPAVLADGIRRLNENYKNYSPLVIKKTAERFSRERFAEEMRKFITKT